MNSMASLNTASDSTLVLPQVTLRDTAVYLLHPERGTLGQTGLHLYSISGGQKGGHIEGSSHESKSRVI